ncbi:MAG: transcriptional regulator [Spirochaetaceae bacterium]|nr:MAG: transcriptional regulator [Spirochaetaceae bacterium]
MGDTVTVAERVISNLRDQRTAAGLTQAQLAEAAGVTRQTIIAIEKGNYTPSVLLALKLARILGTAVEELFAYGE